MCVRHQRRPHRRGHATRLPHLLMRRWVDLLAPSPVSNWLAHHDRLVPQHLVCQPTPHRVMHKRRRRVDHFLHQVAGPLPLQPEPQVLRRGVPQRIDRGGRKLRRHAQFLKLSSIHSDIVGWDRVPPAAAPTPPPVGLRPSLPGSRPNSPQLQFRTQPREPKFTRPRPTLRTASQNSAISPD
jgi:hypothetical protein